MSRARAQLRRLTSVLRETGQLVSVVFPDPRTCCAFAPAPLTCSGRAVLAEIRQPAGTDRRGHARQKVTINLAWHRRVQRQILAQGKGFALCSAGAGSWNSWRRGGDARTCPWPATGCGRTEIVTTDFFETAYRTTTLRRPGGRASRLANSSPGSGRDRKFGQKRKVVPRTWISSVPCRWFGSAFARKTVAVTLGVTAEAGSPPTRTSRRSRASFE